jgi:hypothetical protein
MRKPGANRRRHLPDGTISIGWDQRVEVLADRIEFVPHPYATVPAGNIHPDMLELR